MKKSFLAKAQPNNRKLIISLYHFSQQSCKTYPVRILTIMHPSFGPNYSNCHLVVASNKNQNAQIYY